jgi:hypothetical protein
VGAFHGNFPPFGLKKGAGFGFKKNYNWSISVPFLLVNIIDKYHKYPRTEDLTWKGCLNEESVSILVSGGAVGDLTFRVQPGAFARFDTGSCEQSGAFACFDAGPCEQPDAFACFDASSRH